MPDQKTNKQINTQINILTSISHGYFRATLLISPTFTASTAFSICYSVKHRPLVTTCHPISSVTAEVPSILSNSVALNWLFAHSTSASVGAVLVHSRSVKCTRLSELANFSETKEIPHRPVSEYEPMYEFARLFAEMIWLRREERSGDAPSERSQLPNTD